MARRLGKTDGKNERSVNHEESCYIEWGEGNGRLKSSQGKSSGNVLGVFYRQLPMGRKDTSFGVKYPKVLVSMRI